MFLLVLFIDGCIPSSIKINPRKGDDSKSMFGLKPEREFVSDETAGDSLIELWEYETNGSFAPTSITIYDSFAFVNDLSGRIYCLDIYSGKRLGQVKNKGAVYTAPVIYKSLLIYATAINEDNESNFVLYDFVLGQIKAEAIVKGLVITELIRFSDGVVFTTERGMVYKFNFIGHKVWELDTKTATRSSPAANDEHFLFGNDNGEIVCIDHKNGKLVYREKIEQPFFAGSVLSHGSLYISDDYGTLYNIDIKTGHVKNKFDLGARALMYPAIEADKIFIGNLHGELFSLNENNFSLNWKLKTDGVFNATPLVTNEVLIVPDLNKKFYYVNKADGKILKTYELEGRAKHTPVIKDNKLFIGYDNGIIKAYEILK